MAGQGGRLDLSKIEVFLHVARRKSFSWAAEELGLRQPTVSAHVRTLEQKLGGKLFDRMGREVALTPLGKLLYDQAQKLGAWQEEVKAALEQFYGRVAGRLLLGASTIPGEYLLPSHLSRFKKAYPEVQPALEIGDSRRILKAVEAGELEVGVVGVHPEGEAEPLAFEALWQDRLVLVVSDSHPWGGRGRVSLRELFSEEWIIREPGSGTREVFWRFLQKKGYDPSRLRIHLELGSTEAVKQALLAGLGISVLSETAVGSELKAGTLKAVLVSGFRLTRTFYLVHLRHRTLSPVAQTFCRWIRSARETSPPHSEGIEERGKARIIK